MEKICIFTDSTSDLTPQEAQCWNIDVVPILATVEGKTYREFYDMKPEDYWDILMESDSIPTTSQVPMEELTLQFTRASEQGCTHCIGILINGSGSGTYQTACIVRDMFYEENGRDMHIELIDSETYAYLYGSIAVHAAMMRAQGASFDEIVADMRRRVKSIRAYLGVYSLKYLKKSGRISGGAAFVGEALGMKPISLVNAGRVDVCTKVRGERNLITKLVQMAVKDAVEPEKHTALLLYAKVSAEELDRAERLLCEQGFAAVKRNPIGIAVTTNAGPQSVAVAFYGSERTD